MLSDEESGISKLTLTTLQHIWRKAEELINTENAVTQAPGNDKSAKMVMSYSSPIPHMITRASTSVTLAALTGPHLKYAHTL